MVAAKRTKIIGGVATKSSGHAPNAKVRYASATRVVRNVKSGQASKKASSGRN